MTVSAHSPRPPAGAHLAAFRPRAQAPSGPRTTSRSPSASAASATATCTPPGRGRRGNFVRLSLAARDRSALGCLQRLRAHTRPGRGTAWAGSGQLAASYRVSTACGRVRKPCRAGSGSRPAWRKLSEGCSPTACRVNRRFDRDPDPAGGPPATPRRRCCAGASRSYTPLRQYAREGDAEVERDRHWRPRPPGVAARKGASGGGGARSAARPTRSRGGELGDRPPRHRAAAQGGARPRPQPPHTPRRRRRALPCRAASQGVFCRLGAASEPRSSAHGAGSLSDEAGDRRRQRPTAGVIREMLAWRLSTACRRRWRCARWRRPTTPSTSRARNQAALPHGPRQLKATPTVSP